MEKILHHFETMVETIVYWYFPWAIESETRVSERWCETDSLPGCIGKQSPNFAHVRYSLKV